MSDEDKKPHLEPTIDAGRISDGKIDDRKAADVPAWERGARHGVPCFYAGICSQPAMCHAQGCAKIARRR